MLWGRRDRERLYTAANDMRPQSGAHNTLLIYLYSHGGRARGAHDFLFGSKVARAYLTQPHPDTIWHNCSAARGHQRCACAPFARGGGRELSDMSLESMTLLCRFWDHRAHHGPRQATSATPDLTRQLATYPRSMRQRCEHVHVGPPDPTPDPTGAALTGLW